MAAMPSQVRDAINRHLRANAEPNELSQEIAATAKKEVNLGEDNAEDASPFARFVSPLISQAISQAIDCETEPISADDWPKRCLALADWFIGKLGGKTSLRYFNLMKALGMALMLVSVYWTVSASICDIRYDYAPSRAMANYAKTYHLDKYRWMSGWTRLVKTADTTPSVAELIDKGGYCAGGNDCIDYTSWLPQTQTEMAPYFKHNLAANAYKGHSFASWDWIEHPYKSKKDLAAWKSWGEPEVYDTIYQPFYFSVLGYDRNDYTKVHVVDTVTPWKDQRSTDSYDIYVRNDI